MFKNNIEIANEILLNETKFNRYLTFDSAGHMEDIALILKKYYIWYLKRILKVNVRKNEEKEFFINKLNKCDVEKDKIEISYCLGELYLSKDDIKAKMYFYSVIDKCKKQGIEKKLVFMAEKNIRDIEKLQYKDIVDKKDIIGYEINFGIFNTCNNINYSDELVKKAAFWLSDNCPTYKDVIKLICDYFKKNNSWENFSLCLIKAYEKTGDIKYIEKLVDDFYKIKVLKIENSEKMISMLEAINNYGDIELWSKVIQMLYKIVDKKHLEKILINIEKTLCFTSMYTGELQGQLNILELLITIYNDITKYKGKYKFINKYENTITKNLLYASFQNENIVELYESHSKLKAISKINNIDNSITSALKCLPVVEILNKNELNKITIYPYEILLKNLKYILEGTKVFKIVEESYLTKKLTESKIMLYGMFSSGKSSFINSIISENLLEEGDLPTTSTFTLVGCNEDKVLQDSIKYLVPTHSIIVENTFLRENGILLIDTPGFEDLDSKQGELSSDNLQICNKFIVLLDATRPLTASEYNRIKQIKEKNIKNKILFILNKIDFIDEDEEDVYEIIEDIKIKLRKIVGEDIRILPYSSIMAKQGDLDIKESVYNEIINFISSDKARIRFNLIENCIELSKYELKKEMNNKNDEFDSNIEEIDKIIITLEKLNKILTINLNDYLDYTKNCIQDLRNKIEDYIDISIKGIFKNIPNFLNESSSVENIHEEVRNKLRVYVDKWSKTSYKEYVINSVNGFIKDINNYIIEKDNILTKISLTAKNTCENIYEIENKFFIKNLESSKLVKVLVKNSFKLLQDIYIDIYSIDDLYRPFNMGIQKSVLTSVTTGFSKLFNSETQILDKYKLLINQQSESASEITIEHIKNKNYKLRVLLDSIMYTLCEDSYELNDNLKEYMLQNDCTIEMPSENINVINQYIEDIESIYDDIINIKNDVILEKIKYNELINLMLEEIQCLDVDLLKYRYQIDNGIVYSDRKLYKI